MSLERAQYAMVFLIVFLCMLIFIAIVSIWYDVRLYRARRMLRKRELEEARQYSLVIRAKVEEDRHYELELQKLDLQQQKIALDQDRFRLESFLSLTRVDTSQYGTYLVNQEQVHLTQLAPIHKPFSVKEEPAQIAGLVIQRPSQDLLLSSLEQNKFLVSPGVQSSTGEPVIVDLLKVPHLKIIGSSGFGKSCLAAAILDQATTTNDPKHMQLALLDLEHKTSRLFEDRPHVAELQDGRRRVTMVATNADEVATHLNILKKELDRRAAQSERELYKNPVLLMYVEEMLSLQYEIIDPKLLAKMFASLNILAVRGRKYGMFLLACMQTDYSTDELKVSQKQFRYRAAAAIDVPAARAAGFMNTDLIKENFQNGKPGQFVVEYPSFSNIVLAPQYDVRSLLNEKEGMDEGFSGDFGTAAGEITSHVQLVDSQSTTIVQTSEDDAAKAWEAKAAQVCELLAQNWGKIKIIEHVWRPVKAGSNKPYRQAEKEYDRIVEQLTAEKSEK